MGTSKSYGGLRGNPRWSSMSRTVSLAVNNGSPTQQSLAKVMSRAAEFMGGLNMESSGNSARRMHAGIRTAQQLGSFLIGIQRVGFGASLNNINGGIEINDANQAINAIIEKCAANAGVLDEVAAKAAMRRLLEEIGADANTIEELGEKFDEALDGYGMEELLIMYIGFYIFEHLCTDFYEKLIKTKGQRETDSFYSELKDYIVEKTKTMSRQRDLKAVDWQSTNGKAIMQEIFQSTLNEFENYEG